MATGISPKLLVTLGMNIAPMQVALGKATKNLKTWQANMVRTGQKMQALGKTLSFGLTLPIAALGGVIGKVSADFELSMNKVKAITEATAMEFDMLETQARQLGKTTMFTASQIADGMNYAAKAGFSVNEVYMTMEANVNLAAAAQLDLARSTDIVTNVMRGFQIEADDLQHSVDVLTKGFVSSNTDLEQLGQAMKFVAPVAHGFGLSVEMTTAMIGRLSDAGMQAGIAGRRLSILIAQMAKKSNELGVSMYDSTGKMKPFIKILAEIEKKGFSAAKKRIYRGIKER